MRDLHGNFTEKPRDLFTRESPYGKAIPTVKDTECQQLRTVQSGSSVMEKGDENRCEDFSRDIYSSAPWEDTSAPWVRSCTSVCPDGGAQGPRPPSSKGPSVPSASWTGAMGRRCSINRTFPPVLHSKARRDV